VALSVTLGSRRSRPGVTWRPARGARTFLGIAPATVQPETTRLKYNEAPTLLPCGHQVAGDQSTSRSGMTSVR
jgi:hypothetical protein